MNKNCRLEFLPLKNINTKIKETVPITTRLEIVLITQIYFNYLGDNYRDCYFCLVYFLLCAAAGHEDGSVLKRELIQLFVHTSN